MKNTLGKRKNLIRISSTNSLPCVSVDLDHNNIEELVSILRYITDHNNIMADIFTILDKELTSSEKLLLGKYFNSKKQDNRHIPVKKPTAVFNNGQS